MISRLALSAAAIALAGSVAFAQPAATPPPPERNLQVLPRDIAQRDLINIMQSFNRALGVECSYCHVAGNFASDANGHKNIARGMLRLTQRLNRELLPEIQGLGEPRVSCFTCHRGEAQPATAPGAPPAAPHTHSGERG
ncbi:c-type cytochrome [Sphingosinicella sp. YJ22]|uniref:c-type cytochrome n=1 Tax=Sphingosinicella sp. YJ22 TaxID=1104780 RepID=UPI0014092820|nr:c-type cytochrome [Sphingosinicella sp. YJ22]